MKIKFSCPNCNAKYSVDSQHCGKKVKCKECETIITIPSQEIDNDQITLIPEKSKKQTLTGIMIGFLIASIIFSGYLFKENFLSLFAPQAVDVVNKFLTLSKSIKSAESHTKILTLADSNFGLMLAKQPFYKIEQWEVSKYEPSLNNNKILRVFVKGTAKNTFNAELEIKPVFLVNEKNEITDSEDFFVFKKYSEYSGSDLEVFKLLQDLKNLIVVEDWSFSVDKSYNLKGRAKGKGTIINNSSVPVSFIKAIITYYDHNKNLVNTDNVYAVGGDELFPGMRKVFDWTTPNCEKAVSAELALEF